MSSTTTLPRFDLISIKHDLAEALGENGQEYWQYIKQYFHARISKLELDLYVKDLLTDVHVGLHNTFMKSIMGNAYRTPPPPPSERSTEFKVSKQRQRRRRDQAIHIQLASGRRVHIPKELFQLPFSDRERLKSFLVNQHKPIPLLDPSITNVRSFLRGCSPALFSGSNSPLLAALLSHKKYRVIRQLPSCTQTRTLPNISVVQDLMERTVLEQGLQGVTENCVLLVHLALQQYIKNILFNSLTKLRECKSDGHFSYDVNCNISMLEPFKMRSLVLRDLLFASTLSPYVLGENTGMLLDMNMTLFCDNEYSSKQPPSTQWSSSSRLNS